MAGTPPNSDAEDVRRTLRGDANAFGNLFDRHASGVRAIVAAVSHDFLSVEDLTQETFLRAYRRLGSLRDPAAFGPWVAAFARRVASERRRRLGRRRERDAPPTEAASCEQGPADAAASAELSVRLRGAIAQLPERERLVVHAYYFHGQRVEDCAAAIGVSRSGCYATLNRALARLRKMMAASGSHARA